MADERLTVYWWDIDGGQHVDLRYVDVERAMAAVVRLTTGSARYIVAKVMLTDGGDFCVFEWNAIEGVTWPKDPVVKKAYPPSS